MTAQNFINELRSQGRFSFTTADAEKALGVAKIPCLNALHRLKKHKFIASPAKGFYVIVPPEYQIYGCLPADMFIPDLMKYWKQTYYTGFLSAAQFHGVAHQKPQRFQVVMQKNHQPIQCGRIHIEFIANQYVAKFPTQAFNTLAGKLTVSSPEVLAIDLITAPQHAAGINNVATIMTELAEIIDVQKLIDLTLLNTSVFWIQRLGWLLEFLGFDALANTLFQIIADKKLHWARLVSNAPYQPIERNKKWCIIVNSTVEIDE